MPSQGVGARVQRKEDARHLHGRGNFVSDMILQGQSEVAFLRSPIAHGRIRRIVKSPGTETQVFVRADLDDAASIVAPTTVPGYKLSECPPLAHEKVRFVGEAIAMCIAPTRAEAEDIAEQVEVEFDELPVLVDAHAARAEPTVRVHEDWSDNLFLTLNYESGFDAKAKNAPVVIRREVALARQAMVPMEGKAVLAHWDDRSDQLVVYASTQVPHIIRVGLAQFLGIDQGRVRVISPDVGGGFGYKAVLQPEELCVAWLALKFRRPSAAGFRRSMPRSPSTAAPIRLGRSRSRWSRDKPPATCRGRTPSAAIAAAPIAWRPTSPASCPIAAWRGLASASPWS